MKVTVARAEVQGHGWGSCDVVHRTGGRRDLMRIVGVVRCMAESKAKGRGSRTRPIVVEEPVLVPVLTEQDRAAAVAALTDLMADWWRRRAATVVDDHYL